LEHAATEEVDHLLWCKERLNELNTHESYLNPLWYLSSFLLGFLTAKRSDAVSLGFVEETEKQVMTHLEKHQAALPPQDYKSRAIIDVMKTDEERHAENAKILGAVPLSHFMKWVMKLQSRFMTSTAYFL
jgi:ubiquinone biosynthesis monooxygenase Coq7